MDTKKRNFKTKNMITDRNGLINAYNATSTDDGNGDIESYESWLERQLIARIAKIDALENPITLKDCPTCCHTGSIPWVDCPTCKGTGNKI